MNFRRTIASVIATIALIAAIAGPALAVAPTFSGTVRCIDSRDGSIRDLNTRDDWTKRDIAASRRFWGSSGFCEKNSFYSSDLVKNA